MLSFNRDDVGEEFAREEDARTHAARVASELARNNLDRSMSGRHLIVMNKNRITQPARRSRGTDK
jgi:hypothetical protein